MLQQIREKLHGWFATVFLGAIAVVFVFWGIRFESGVNKSAVTVNGAKIPLELVRKAWQERQTELQQQLRSDIPAEVAKREQEKLLDGFISRELMVQRAREMGYVVSDAELAETLYRIPALQVDGKFSRDRYAALLRQQGRTEPEFEREFRHDLETAQLRGGIAISSFVTPGEIQRRVALEAETRDVEYAVLPAASFAGAAAVAPADVAAYYDKHKSEFMTPETVSLQYLELNLADVAAAVQVTDKALHDYYDQVAADRYTDPERRHGSHILIESGTDDAAALKKAQQLVERAKAGEDFAKLARENSDDPGSKAAGGDLGWSTRDAFVAPFADALFGMQKGEIRGPVKTQFGYHVIRLEDVQPAHQRTFDEVRTDLEADYRKDQAQSVFYEKSQQLADESFAALSELDSVGKKLGLPLQTIDAYTRQGGGPFGNDRKVIEAVFSDDVLQQRQNSQPVSVGDDKVVVLRVTDHKVAQQQPLEAVQADVEARLRAEAARKSAEAAAVAAAARVAAGESLAAAAGSGAQLTAKQSLGRAGTESVAPEVIKAAFGLAHPAPGKVSVGTASLASGDAAIVVVSAVRSGGAGVSPDQLQALRAQTARRVSEQAAATEFAAYANEVQRAAKIKKNPDVFSE
ncbi:MAG TPA: SurA N-terminal domain-containing protein [Steroidobacteraceae bacterium]